MADIDSFLSRAPVFKRIDEPWIGLLVLAIVIFVVAIIAIIFLFIFWRRHEKQTQVQNRSYILSNKPTGKIQIPVQLGDQQPQPYETQKMDMFVPQNNGENFPSSDGIQHVRQVYERTTKAYY